MKVINRWGRYANESVIQYKSKRESALYRYRLLKKIIEGESDVTIIVDTNQCVGEKPFEAIEDLLQSKGIEYVLAPVSPNSISFFGIRINAGRRAGPERLLVAKLTADKFSQDFYTEFLDCYDIALGIESTKPVKEICEQIVNGEQVLFNTSFFRDSVYDSVVCTMMRSTMDVEKYVEAVKNEVAL